MADKQIRIDVTAEDDASKTLDDVAEAAGKLEDAKPTVTVTADTSDALADVGDVADAVKELDAQAATVDVAADTSAARGDVAALSDDIATLSRQDTEILLRARIDDAKGALKALRDDLQDTAHEAKKTADKLDDVGDVDRGRFSARGNAIADLTGPLGDASGAASDFAGVFDGIGDIAEGVASKVGIEAEHMATAIGGIGFAIAAAAAVWTFFRQKQEEARQKQKELIEGQEKFQDLVEEGKFREAAEQITTLYKDAFNAATDAGVPIQQVTDYILGLTDALPDASDELERLNKMVEDGKLTADAADQIYKNLNDTFTDARTKYRDTNGSIREQNERLDTLADTLKKTKGRTDDQTEATERMRRETDKARDGFDKLKGALDFERAFLDFQTDMAEAMDKTRGKTQLTSDEILGLKEDVLNVAEAVKLTPIQVKSLLQRIDRGDIEGVKGYVEYVWNSNPPDVRATFVPPTQADVDRIKAELRAKFGTLNVPVEAVPTHRNGSTYTGPR